jgi:hypothetical protein
MATIKKPPETIERTLRLEEPVSHLLDDYSRFVDCAPDYVANVALRDVLARDPEYKRWKASRPGNSARKPTGDATPFPRSS